LTGTLARIIQHEVDQEISTQRHKAKRQTWLVTKTTKGFR